MGHDTVERYRLGPVVVKKLASVKKIVCLMY